MRSLVLLIYIPDASLSSQKSTAGPSILLVDMEGNGCYN